MKKTIHFSACLVAALLGGLWLLHGLGLVHIRAIFCFGDCVPVQGPSATWAVVGALVLAVGLAAMAAVWLLYRDPNHVRKSLAPCCFSNG